MSGFTGFTPEMFEFFMAIRFNNHEAFFHENHAWYQRAVRRLMLALAEELAPSVSQMDEELDTRPTRAVSRLRRDTRFSHDKTPYRDYMWLGYRRVGVPKELCYLPYFDIGVDGCGCGLGSHNPSTETMRMFRRHVLAMPREFLAAIQPLQGMEIGGQPYRRLPSGVDIPALEAMEESLRAQVRPWLMWKVFYVQQELEEKRAMGPELVQDVAEVFRRITPLYRFMKNAQNAAQAL